MQVGFARVIWAEYIAPILLLDAVVRQSVSFATKSTKTQDTFQREFELLVLLCGQTQQ